AQMLSTEAVSVTCALIVQVPLLLFHFSVDICVFRQISRKTAGFTAGFYTLFLWQSFIDVCDFLVVKAMQLSRLDVFIPDQLYLVPWRLRLGFVLVNYCLAFQVLMHTCIAVNRYTAIVRPMDHKL
ncbi:hypothetical protein AAVH_30142, partial [Aphelenchoides avenae]